jgi:hypothetical protein
MNETKVDREVNKLIWVVIIIVCLALALMFWIGTENGKSQGFQSGFNNCSAGNYTYVAQGINLTLNYFNSICENVGNDTSYVYLRCKND